MTGTIIKLVLEIVASLWRIILLYADALVYLLCTYEVGQRRPKITEPNIY